MSNPEPLEYVGAFSGKRAVMKANARGVKHANFLEPDGWMPGIRLEHGEVFVSKRPDVLGKFTIVKPEIRVGKMVQSGVQRPAL